MSEQRQVTLHGTRGARKAHIGFVLAFTLGLLIPGAASLEAQDPPEVFQIRGDAKLDVKGPIAIRGRKWQYEIPGSFESVLEVDPDGTVRLARVSIRMADVTASRGRREAYHFRCGRASTVTRPVGTVDGAGNLLFPPGTATLYVGSHSERGRGGGCPGTGTFTRLTVVNNRPVSGLHDPGADVFLLSGSFDTRFEGENIDVDIALEGTYVNRPPVARLGVEGEGVDLVQGGCPPLTGLNPPSTEANDPQGLLLFLQSNSWDPDDVFAQSDLALTQWQHWTGTSVGPPAGTYRFLGRGRRIGPVLFELDQHHTLILRVTDHERAEDTTSCGFFVTDTTPPAITPPDPITLPCTVTGGATPATSERLRDFLEEATADDLIDPSPVRLPPRVDGLVVADDTLFPVGEITPVSFRYRDRHGNLGEAASTVRVVRKKPLDLGMGSGIPEIRGDGRWTTLRPRIETGGACGFRQIYLLSVRSDGPELPQQLVRGAVFGRDARELEILAVPIKNRDGSLRDRTFELVWVGIDADGRQTRLIEEIVIKAPGGTD